MPPRFVKLDEEFSVESNIASELIWAMQMCLYLLCLISHVLLRKACHYYFALCVINAAKPSDFRGFSPIRFPAMVALFLYCPVTMIFVR